MPGIITIDQLAKAYDSKYALRFFSLDIFPREVHVLVGPSGSGKSTLLKCILGLVKPDDGTIRVSDILLTRFSAGKIRRKTGYVVQGGGLFPHLTARENALLVPKTRGWTIDRCLNRLQDLAKMTGLAWEDLHKYPHQLSGGQRQRVGIIRALMMDPEILLMDEPLASLDPMVRASLKADLKALFARLGKTVIWVTHDLDEAAELAHRVSLIHGGKIIQTGSFQQLLKAPSQAFVSDFFSAQKPSPGWGQ